MRFKLQIDGVEREVKAGPAGDLSVDGAASAAKVTAPSADRRTVEVNGKSYEIRIVEGAAEEGEILLELAGERVAVKVREVVKEAVGAAAPVVAERPAAPDATAGSGTAAGAAGASARRESPPQPGEAAATSAEDLKEGVWAPMPGKIAKVLVKAGQEVKEGDPVVVLEAMKMENELRSPASGTVKSVHVAEGDQADRGQLLIALA